MTVSAVWAAVLTFPAIRAVVAEQAARLVPARTR